MKILIRYFPIPINNFDYAIGLRDESMSHLTQALHIFAGNDLSDAYDRAKRYANEQGYDDISIEEHLLKDLKRANAALKAGR